MRKKSVTSHGGTADEIKIEETNEHDNEGKQPSSILNMKYNEPIQFIDININNIFEYDLNKLDVRKINNHVNLNDICKLYYYLNKNSMAYALKHPPTIMDIICVEKFCTLNNVDFGQLKKWTLNDHKNKLKDKEREKDEINETEREKNKSSSEDYGESQKEEYDDEHKYMVKKKKIKRNSYNEKLSIGDSSSSESASSVFSSSDSSSCNSEEEEEEYEEEDQKKKPLTNLQQIEVIKKNIEINNRNKWKKKQHMSSCKTPFMKYDTVCIYTDKKQDSCSQIYKFLKKNDKVSILCQWIYNNKDCNNFSYNNYETYLCEWKVLPHLGYFHEKRIDKVKEKINVYNFYEFLYLFNDFPFCHKHNCSGFKILNLQKRKNQPQSLVGGDVMENSEHKKEKSKDEEVMLQTNRTYKRVKNENEEVINLTSSDTEKSDEEDNIDSTCVYEEDIICNEGNQDGMHRKKKNCCFKMFYYENFIYKNEEILLKPPKNCIIINRKKEKDLKFLFKSDVYERITDTNHVLYKENNDYVLCHKNFDCLYFFCFNCKFYYDINIILFTQLTKSMNSKDNTCMNLHKYKRLFHIKIRRQKIRQTDIYFICMNCVHNKILNVHVYIEYLHYFCDRVNSFNHNFNLYNEYMRDIFNVENVSFFSFYNVSKEAALSVKKRMNLLENLKNVRSGGTGSLKGKKETNLSVSLRKRRSNEQNMNDFITIGEKNISNKNSKKEFTENKNEKDKEKIINTTDVLNNEFIEKSTTHQMKQKTKSNVNDNKCQNTEEKTTNEQKETPEKKHNQKSTTGMKERRNKMRKKRRKLNEDDEYFHEFDFSEETEQSQFDNELDQITDEEIVEETQILNEEIYSDDSFIYGEEDEYGNKKRKRKKKRRPTKKREGSRNKKGNTKEEQTNHMQTTGIVTPTAVTTSGNTTNEKGSGNKKNASSQNTNVDEVEEREIDGNEEEDVQNVSKYKKVIEKIKKSFDEDISQNNNVDTRKISESIVEEVIKTHKNKSDIKMKLFSLCSNLSRKDNAELRKKVLKGVISCEDLANMSVSDLAPISLQNKRKEYERKYFYESIYLRGEYINVKQKISNDEEDAISQNIVSEEELKLNMLKYESSKKRTSDITNEENEKGEVHYSIENNEISEKTNELSKHQMNHSLCKNAKQTLNHFDDYHMGMYQDGEMNEKIRFENQKKNSTRSEDSVFQKEINNKGTSSLTNLNNHYDKGGDKKRTIEAEPFKTQDRNSSVIPSINNYTLEETYSYLKSIHTQIPKYAGTPILTYLDTGFNRIKSLIKKNKMLENEELEE